MFPINREFPYHKGFAELQIFTYSMQKCVLPGKVVVTKFDINMEPVGRHALN